LTSSPVVIRTSDRNYFKRCRQLWDLTSKIRQNWEPIQRYPAFDFGTAIHEGLRAYYEPATWGDLKLMRQNAREAFASTYEKLFAKVTIGDVQFEMDITETIDVGNRMLEYYFLYAKKNDEGWTPKFVEIEFEVPIPGLPNCVYQGRIDLIVEDEYGYWIVDHKTAKQFRGTGWLSLDDQCGSYAWAIREMLGLNVRGVIFNELRKSPPHKPNVLKSGMLSVNKQQDTTFDVFLRTCRELDHDPRWYIDYLRHLKYNEKEFIRRTRTTYRPESLEIVQQRIQKEATEMSNPNVSIYPSPSSMNCDGCRFFGPCLQIQDGMEPSMDMYERRSA
jgi:hypothetical protein